MKRQLFHLVILITIAFNCFAQPAKFYSKEERELIVSLYDIGVLRFDTEALNCPESPYYIDLRHIISYPVILKKITHMIVQRSKELSFDSICGVPYAALVLSSTVAYELEKPLLMRRSHIKNYGTRKKIEGVFAKENVCLVIEDVVTTASSLIETIKDLENHQLKAPDSIILFDREQGGVQWMRDQGYNLHVLFTITDFMNVLSEEGKISAEFAKSVLDWTKKNQIAGINWKVTQNK